MSRNSKMVRWLKTLIRNLIQEQIADIHNHANVQIQSYDSLLNLATVIPCTKKLRTQDPDNATTIKYAVIEDVPVMHRGSGPLLLSCAPVAGSYGVLHINDRAIDDWLTLGGIQDPSSVRKFDMNDGFLECGIYPIMPDGNNGALVVPVNTDCLEIRTRLGTSYVSVYDDGTIELASMSLGTFTIDIDGTITGSTTLGEFSLNGTTGQFDANGNFTVDP